MKKKILMGLYYLGGCAIILMGAFVLEQIVVLAVKGDQTPYAIAPLSDKPNFDQTPSRTK